MYTKHPVSAPMSFYSILMRKPNQTKPKENDAKMCAHITNGSNSQHGTTHKPKSMLIFLNELKS